MGTVFRILTLCHVLNLFGRVTSDSCGSDPYQSETKLHVNIDSMIAFLETTKQSEGSASPKYFYSKEAISCTKIEDCSLQGCCGDKKVACNGDTKKCDCLDSSNKFTGRPLLYIKNDGKCGNNEAGCTICLELYKSGDKLSLGQGQTLNGNRNALALSSNGNQTGLMKTGDSERDVRLLEGLTITVNQLPGGLGALILQAKGVVTSTAAGLSLVATGLITGALGIGVQ